MKLPEFFENNFREMMKAEEFDAFKASFDGTRHYGLRINTLKVEKEHFLKLTKMKLSEIPWVPEGFYYEFEDSPGKHPYYHAGLYYIQEPSAMMPARILSPNPGERVLDLCAAPGGKTTHLGTLMKNEGLIVTNDISPKRVKALVKNIELMGLTNTLTVNETPEKLLSIFPEYFDRILLDVPCSGEGMFRKDKEAVQSYTRYKSCECVSLQQDIFDYAYGMLKAGGTLVYSTCTFNAEENERNIEYFAKRYGLEVVALNPIGGWESSRGEWTESRDARFSGGLRLWPHKGRGEGHFVCLLKKPGELKPVEMDNTGSLHQFTSKEAEKATAAFIAFAQENMNTNTGGVYHIRGSSLYRLPPHLLSVPQVKWEKAGLYVGEYQKERFEPSQSLLMSSKAHEFKRSIHFSSEDQETFRYLKGETLLIDGEKGFTAVCVDGFPLGWAKQEKGMLKNLYPKGWRMM